MEKSKRTDLHIIGRHRQNLQVLTFLLLISATHNKMFSGYQPCQLVERRKKQRFKDHLCPHPQGDQHPEEEDRDGP
jgi:hypothetical protein